MYKYKLLGLELPSIIVLIIERSKYIDRNMELQYR